MRSHRTILLSIRWVYFLLISALAFQAWRAGSLGWTMPVILGVYVMTLATMMGERASSFSKERVQGALIIFDLFVLVVALICLKEHRQELLVAIFLVVILASASRRLSISMACFVAVAFAYAWFALPASQWTRALASLAPRLAALLVVAMYVGYLSESLSIETCRRVEAEERLRRELAGLRRGQELTSRLTAAMDPGQLLPAIAENAANLLDAAGAAIFWKRNGEAGTECARDASRIARWMDDPVSVETLPGVLTAPFSAPASGLEGVLVVDMRREPRDVEREALEVVGRTGSLLLENAALRGCLAQARDSWQAAFQAVPLAVAIVDAEGRVVQANDAFARLTGQDPLELQGRPIPDLGDRPEVAKGPFYSSNLEAPGSVKVFAAT